MINTQKVYDLPTRFFHWLFAGGFVAAFLIAKTLDDDSALYPYHMMVGMVLGFAVILRFFWGLWGSRYARFSSFSLNPKDLFQYFIDMIRGQRQRELGHNPASSWAAIIMMGLTLGLGVTGYLMVQGQNKEFYEEVHELFANMFLVVVIAHVAGVLFHSLRYQDRIAFSMIHGQKKEVVGAQEIEKSHAGVGLLFIALIGVFVFHLNKNYAPDTRTLNLFGTTLQLGENENEQEGEGGGEQGDNDDDEEKDEHE